MVEYKNSTIPNAVNLDGDCITRKRLRNRMKRMLPFELQKKIGNGRNLIKHVDVVSIDEWNRNELYGRYPIRLKENISEGKGL